MKRSFLIAMLLIVLSVVSAETHAQSCPGPNSRLAIGSFARVNIGSLNVVSNPDTQVVIARLSSGDVVQVVSPARCVNNIPYWGVTPIESSASFGVGYIAELRGNRYYVAPTTVGATNRNTTPSVTLPSLPGTGETPWWRNWLLLVFGLLVSAIGWRAYHIRTKVVRREVHHG